ncbi:alkaline phosphatase [Acinetobacter sp. YH16032]|uniref:alkaline phosphatase D family protein n=1 Tax=Acinetobacter sp. YH16032 TaxID=2601181 RepID=UPI0015D3E425|nr:alkaline phosphatase D family protein [Acinetobacter sp. YH16032]
MKNKISRRALIKNSLAGLGAISLPVLITACNGDGQTSNEHKVEFLHGVASGDPLQDRIILWSRITPTDVAAIYELDWEIALDENFSNIVQMGKIKTSAAKDFCLKVDVLNLSADTRYYYRFKYGQIHSPIGRTKTLATKSNAVNFAVCSCSNYPAGYFYVYREIAKQDVDAVLHLGDYIYEYGKDGYAAEQAEKLGRTLDVDNQNEIYRLEDYRKRYAKYRTDPDLQAVHQRHPFILIWDDHELTNDAWRAGAQNHQPDLEGDFVARRTAALTAYFEWMPIREKSNNDILHIYRQFNFGDLVQLNMLDTRMLARDEQLAFASFMDGENLNVEQFRAALMNEQRQLIGIDQLNWLANSLQSSRAIWNVLGQQVLMAKMLVPAEVLQILNVAKSGMVDDNFLIEAQKRLMELVAIKLRYKNSDPSLTDAELSRILTVIPYNLDAWDGYYAERERVYALYEQYQKKVVVLAGDTHNAWESALHQQNGEKVGIELATSSVSSPGMEKYLNLPENLMQQFEQVFIQLIDELRFCNLNQRGYLKLSFDSTQLSADWLFLTDIHSQKYQVDQLRLHSTTYDTNLNIIKVMQQAS